MVKKTEKELGKLSRQQLRHFFSLQYALRAEIEDVDNLIKDPPAALREVLDQMPPWALFYELPYPHLLACFIHMPGLTEFVQQAAESEDPQQVMLDFMDSNAEPAIAAEEYDLEQKALTSTLLIATIVNIEAVRVFSLSMCDLVTRASKGDRNAFFNAVLLDRT